MIAVLGAKGVGKSIVTRKALETLRRQHGYITVFVTVDCRRQLSQRRVLRQLADALHQELVKMRDHGIGKVSSELVDTAAVVKRIPTWPWSSSVMETGHG